MKFINIIHIVLKLGFLYVLLGGEVFSQAPPPDPGFEDVPIEIEDEITQVCTKRICSCTHIYDPITMWLDTRHVVARVYYVIEFQNDFWKIVDFRGKLMLRVKFTLLIDLECVCTPLTDPDAFTFCLLAISDCETICLFCRS